MARGECSDRWKVEASSTVGPNYPWDFFPWPQCSNISEESVFTLISVISATVLTSHERLTHIVWGFRWIKVLSLRIPFHEAKWLSCAKYCTSFEGHFNCYRAKLRNRMHTRSRVIMVQGSFKSHAFNRNLPVMKHKDGNDIATAVFTCNKST
jgi:hypothetical protein